METSNIFGTYVTRSPTLNVLPTLSFECQKIKSLPTAQRILLKLKVSGRNGWFEDKYDLELVPSSNKIRLSNTNFKIEEEWVIRFYIECSDVLNGYLQVKINGRDSNRVNVNFVNNLSDVFYQSDINIFIVENNVSIINHTPCIIASDKQLGKLLKNTTDFIINTSNNGANVLTAYTRIKQIKDKGFVESENIFNQYVFNGGGNYKPIRFESGKENVISIYLKSAIKDQVGFHVFYFTILNGYHVLTLIVDSTNPCDMKFKIYDQLKDRGDYINFSEIDNKILEMNTNNWQGAADLTRDKTASTKFGIWKIKRK